MTLIAEGALEQGLEVSVAASRASADLQMINIQLSAAISAKRQADALEVIADRLRDLAGGTGILEALRTPLNDYGESIGECIQGQLGRGQR